jgi:hypothetical protein
VADASPCGLKPLVGLVVVGDELDELEPQAPRSDARTVTAAHAMLKRQ